MDEVNALRTARLRADHPDAVRLLEAYFAELRARLGAFDPARSVSATADEMERPHGLFLVLYDGAHAVACGGLKRLDPMTGEVKRMFVAPSARRRGHGRRVLEALEVAARSLGLTRLVLDTAAPLVEAARLYRSAGYHDVPPYNANPFAAAWLAKDLATASAPSPSCRAASPSRPSPGSSSAS